MFPVFFSVKKRRPSNRRRLPSNRRWLPSNRRWLPSKRRRLPSNRRLLFNNKNDLCTEFQNPMSLFALGKVLRQKVKDVLLCEKAPPEFDTKPQDQSRFQLSSMSHIVNHTASGYIALPDFPSAQPDMGLRDVDDRRHLYSDDGVCAPLHRAAPPAPHRAAQHRTRHSLAQHSAECGTGQCNTV